jgi:hypothetical protein
VPDRLRLEADRLDSEVGGALVEELLDDLRARYGAVTAVPA